MAKTTTFAITHFSVAFAVTYSLTGDLLIGGLIALVEPAVNTVAYFFHEKIWNNIQAKKQLTIADNSPEPIRAAIQC